MSHRILARCTGRLTGMVIRTLGRLVSADIAQGDRADAVATRWSARHGTPSSSQHSQRCAPLSRDSCTVVRVLLEGGRHPETDRAQNPRPGRQPPPPVFWRGGSGPGRWRAPGVWVESGRALRPQLPQEVARSHDQDAWRSSNVEEVAIESEDEARSTGECGRHDLVVSRVHGHSAGR